MAKNLNDYGDNLLPNNLCYFLNSNFLKLNSCKINFIQFLFFYEQLIYNLRELMLRY